MATYRLKQGGLPETSGVRHEMGLWSLSTGHTSPTLAAPVKKPKDVTCFGVDARMR
jgi:hypothetical protein